MKVDSLLIETRDFQEDKVGLAVITQTVDQMKSLQNQGVARVTVFLMKKEGFMTEVKGA